ncbi:MAG: hypothetical protein II197_06030 [Peptococcaceae bacterium]|jgi:hypothetical protein|nr:hypothetical protein [Peptococcaceae bacterium]MBQ5857768.1 hypothetical protein [Peptococcaceae bacterium]
MNPELTALQKQLDCCQQDFHQLLHEYARIRKKSPHLRTEAARLMEQNLIRMGRMVKQINLEYHDDLLQGISLLKLKMML